MKDHPTLEGDEREKFIDGNPGIIRKAHMNSYNILIGELDPKTLFETEEEIVALVHHVEEGFTRERLESMLDYFEHYEEYEKCAVIRDYIKVNF